jgi:uncharacterized oxidoreductase
MTEALIPTQALSRWVVDLWVAAGSHHREAQLTADHLVGANLAGHDSHGVGMIPRYVKSLLADELQLNRRIEVLTDAGGVLAIDGQRGMGQSVTHQAMELAIERARDTGVCVMGLRHAHHLGRVGHWAEQAVQAGMVSIHFTNALGSQVLVAPHGGIEPRFLTNPFTVGIPREDGDALILDFATSAIAQGKVRVAYNKGVPVPAGALIDAKGEDTCDPGVMFPASTGEPQGALLPAGGHKGYALAMVCELLGAALTGGDTARPQNQTMQWAVWNNMLTIVFDPARLGSGQAFETEARHFVQWVKSSPLRAQVDAIRMPGDPERENRQARSERIPVDQGTLAQLDEASREIAGRSGQSPGPLSALVCGC